MKKTLLLLAATAMVASSTVASAQTRGGYDGRNSGGSYDTRSGRDGHSYSTQYRAGQRLDQRYRTRDRQVTDYQRYRLSAPPRGYSYYRDDNGNVVLAAIATGIIAFALADIFNNNNNNSYNNNYNYDPRYDGGYNAPYNGGYNTPYNGGYSNGRSPIYYDRYGRPYTVDRYGNSVWVR